MKNLKYSLLVLAVFFTMKSGWCQLATFNHPELEWFTIETEHFEVHYHNGAERTARVVAKVAEDIYQPVTSLYDWEPDGKIHFIVKDYDDNSNGAAYYYDNKVEIWAPQMTFILRGTHNWLRNVVTHEFTHIISLGAARKFTRRVPAFYLQMFGYEPEKRPDVLYGYPNVIISYPVASTIMPMWLAEGMAQFQAPGLDYDRWDTHRDMLIRTAVIGNKLHSFDEMGVFGKNSLGNERTYNAGYALTRYIAARWSPNALRQLSESMKKVNRISIDGAIKDVTGVDAKTLYAQWRDELNKYYHERLAIIEKNRVEGKTLTKKGIGNTYPSWSPDGTKIAYCGSEASDYLTLTNLNIYDLKTGKSKTIKGGVNSQIAWSPDGTKLLYTRIRTADHQSRFTDVHIYDIEKKKEKRLTHGLRALEADWSPDGTQIVCVVQKDGTDNLILLDEHGKLSKQLTDNKNGEALFSPRWSPDGKWIVFSEGRHHGRDLKLVNVQSGETKYLVENKGDARDPVFSADGRKIYFSWDRSGIFNIYSIDPDNFQIQQWTNVVGGAFMPSISPDGKLAFSNFEAVGYKVAVIEKPVEIDSEKAVYRDIKERRTLGLDNSIQPNDPYLTSIRNYDDTKLPDVKSSQYNMTYGQISFLPRAMLDSNRVKLGTYFYASDILDRYSMLGGFAMNARRDIDAFAMFEYRRLAPTLFLELYGFTRNIKRDIEVIEDYPQKVKVDIGFNILEADIGASYQISRDQRVRFAYAHSRYTSKVKDFFFKNIKWVSPQNTYFIGNQFSLTWHFDKVVPRLDSRINPSAGRKIDVRYSREFNKFFDDFATNNEYGTLVEKYSRYNYNRVEMNWHEYFTLPWDHRHTLSAHFHGGWIDRPVDSFFHFFAGGLPGLRGYPFYSIEGRKLLVGRLTYRLPLFKHWQKRFFTITTDKMYLSAFLDYGNAFDKDAVKLSDFKKDVGVSLRFSAFSFYGFPTAFSLQAAYGFDKVVNNNTIYGKEWRYYVTLLFDFLE